MNPLCCETKAFACRYKKVTYVYCIYGTYINLYISSGSWEVFKLYKRVTSNHFLKKAALLIDFLFIPSTFVGLSSSLSSVKHLANTSPNILILSETQLPTDVFVDSHF